jgi:hypothetical protein
MLCAPLFWMHTNSTGKEFISIRGFGGMLGNALVQT